MYVCMYGDLYLLHVSHHIEHHFKGNYFVVSIKLALEHSDLLAVTSPKYIH